MENAVEKPIESARNAPFLVWVEYTKAFALMLIILVHFTEAVICCPNFANPGANWPPVEQRFAQLQPIEYETISPIILNIWRYVGWSGDAGVQLFLIISGFGLTWGLLHRFGISAVPIKWFFKRRLFRIYPLWWGAHILAVVLVILGILSGDVFSRWFVLSLAGYRLPPIMYYLAPAWWYIGLMIQLYIIFPLLWKVLTRLGSVKSFLFVALISFAIRGIGLFVLEQYSPSYIDMWSRGAVFITRLPEFFFGMSFAWHLYHNREQVERLAKHPLAIPFAILIYAVGMLLSLLFWGMTFALFLLGLGLFIPVFVVFRNTSRSNRFDLGVWIGKHSYSIFLTHHLFIRSPLIPRSLDNPNALLIRFSIALILSVVSALLLERVVDWATSLIRNWYMRYGKLGVSLRLGLVGFAVLFLVLGSELLVRWVDPQEVNGWGERASLEPSEDFGWRLIPSQTTRLRWLSYDYTVVSNSLGFPGPEYDPIKPPGTYRILVVGDAYSSAEGVDTDRAWSRLLENELNGQMTADNIEVMNFSITGYGPNQYAAVISKFAPIYNPDLVIVQMFVNDYDDVMISDDDFRSNIGFSRVKQDSFRTYLDMSHLRSFMRKRVIPVLFNQDDPNGNFFGYFKAMEVNQEDYEEKQQRVSSRLEEIQSIVQGIDGKLMVVLVPAPSQVCSASELPYYPSSVDLSDTSKYDINLPQETTAKILAALDIDLYDLREPLSETSECPYQPHNLHWLESGHQAVADYIAQVISG